MVFPKNKNKINTHKIDDDNDTEHYINYKAILQVSKKNSPTDLTYVVPLGGTLKNDSFQMMLEYQYGNKIWMIIFNQSYIT